MITKRSVKVKPAKTIDLLLFCSELTASDDSDRVTLRVVGLVRSDDDQHLLETRRRPLRFVHVRCEVLVERLLRKAVGDRINVAGLDDQRPSYRGQMYQII